MSAPTELHSIRSLLRRQDLNEHLHEMLVLQRSDLLRRKGSHARWIARRAKKRDQNAEASMQRAADLAQDAALREVA